MGTDVEGLLRELAPATLGAVIRRYGWLDAGEDAVQEALLAASARWAERGAPPACPSAGTSTRQAARLSAG